MKKLPSRLTGGASSYELPHHTIDENKEQIHAEEQLKSNKDGLVLSVKEPSMIQDKLVDSVKDVKKVTISSTGETYKSSKLIKHINPNINLGFKR